MINEMERVYRAESEEFNEVESRLCYVRGEGYVFRIVPRDNDGIGYGYKIGVFGSWTNGQRVLVLKCNRQSKKRYEEALGIFNEIEGEYITLLESLSDGKLKVIRDEFTQSERDRYAS